MVFSLAEGLVDQIKAYLDANLAAKLAALNDEYSDAIALDVPVATYKGLKSLATIPNYPVLYIISPAQTVRGMQVSGTSAAVEARPEVVVGMLVMDPDGEQLQLRLYRYGRALAELMLEGMGTASLGGWNLATDQEWELDTESSPFALDTDTRSYLGEVSLAMRANKIETK